MLDGEQWSELLRGFIEEARDLARQAEECLLELERNPADGEAITRLFRAMHTLKGSAGLFSLLPLVNFTHHLENLLMAVRDGERALTAELVSLMLRCLDEITSMVALIDPASGELPVDAAHQRELLDALAALTGNEPELIPTQAIDCPARGRLDACASCEAQGAWHISLRFDGELLRNGFDPATFVRYLGRLGEVLCLHLIDDAVPALEELDAERCYLGLEIALCTSAERAAIEEAFEFIRDFCSLRILPPGSQVDDYLALMRELPESDERIGAILVASGLLDEQDLARGLALQAQHSDALKPALGSVLVDQGLVPAQAVNAALAQQQKARERAPESSLIRVAAHKLDELINLVGELVISAAAAQLHARASGDSASSESAQTVNRHVELIREAALKLRMVEIGETFSRFHRVVRDVSQQLDKRIRLEIHGADTELDKSVIDKLADPLTHLVRNAMDHGIEPAGQRIEAGKAPEGLLRLNAFHESGTVVIEVSDDGRGLDTRRIRAKAVERGLIEAGATLSEQELQRLIFAAGFSTADSVSDLSGRGVGMDVVRSAIEALRGSIEIDSRAGQGSTFRIRLPLTLAIIDGFQVSLGDEQFVVPLGLVTECMELPPHAGDGACGYIDLRGRPLPCIDLAAHFGLPGSRGGRRNIVVVSHGRQQAGLVVDHLHGELQTVIKPLGPLFQHQQGIAGSTILGSGQVALILDIATLFASLDEQPTHHPVDSDPQQSHRHPQAAGAQETPHEIHP